MTRFSLALGSAALALFPLAPVHAQGGLGGFGGGMGGMMGAPGEQDRDAVVSQNVLTPGQYVEYPLTVKAGEAILADALTTNFDAALQVTDAEGKVLAENDDMAPGNQNSRLLFRFPAAGSYKLIVRAFKGIAGGSFELRLRRFMPRDISIGESQTGKAMMEAAYSYYRFSAEKGQKIVASLNRLDAYTGMILFSPEGMGVNPMENLRPGTERFEIPKKGDYYLRVSYPMEISIAEIRSLPHSLGQTSESQVLKKGGAHTWRFSGKAGQVIAVHVPADTPLRARLTPVGALGERAPTAFHQLGSDPKEQSRFSGILRHDGEYEITILAAVDRDVSYQLITEFVAKSWESAARTGNLKTGGIDDFLITAKAGELLRLDLSSETFDNLLELVDLNGNLVARDDDHGGDRNARITHLMTAQGTYLVRVFSRGYGGGGAYRLKRSALAPRPLPRGPKESATLVAGELQLWSFTGKAGETVIFQARTTNFAASVSVRDAKGRFLSCTGGSGLYACTLPADGTYTAQVRSEDGRAGAYTLHVINGD